MKNLVIASQSVKFCNFLASEIWHNNTVVCMTWYSASYWFLQQCLWTHYDYLTNVWICRNAQYWWRTMAKNDVCSHVKVVVRVRPTSDNERRENCRNVVQVVDSHMLIFDPKEEDLSCFGSRKGQTRSRNINQRANKDMKFVFDHVFDENSTQVELFESTTKEILDGLMNGCNCTGKWWLMLSVYVVCPVLLVVEAAVAVAELLFESTLKGFWLVAILQLPSQLFVRVP